MTDKTILLVEDDFLNRRLYRKALCENGYHVLEAKNAPIAVSLLNTEIIDLAILDINLGENEVDGIQLGEQIKEQYHLPFIYLTAYDNPQVIKRAIGTSPYLYLTKPFRNVDLITSVEIAIRQSVNRIAEKAEKILIVKDGEYHIKVTVENIDYIESEGNYLLLNVNNKKYKYRSTIKQIIDTLPEHTFIQTHRAFIVNRSKIEKFKSKYLIVNNHIIPISKNYFDRIAM